MSAPRAQRFGNKYGSETDAEKRVNSSMEHKKESNKIEREEYNAGPPRGQKGAAGSGAFLTADWMEGYVCSLDIEGEIDCVVIHLYLNVKTFSRPFPATSPQSRVFYTNKGGEMRTPNYSYVTRARTLLIG